MISQDVPAQQPVVPTRKKVYPRPEETGNILSKPWRNLGSDAWSPQVKTDTKTDSKDLFNFKTKSILKKEIVTHDITEEAGIDNVNVLLLGEIGSFSRNGFVK